MRRYGTMIAICLLVVVNGVVLAGVAYNRSGTPAAMLTLTERELPLDSYYDYTARENTGLSLHLRWSTGDTYPSLLFSYQRRENDKTIWFDKAKLEAVGFDCKVPLENPGAELYYQKMLPRKTYAVLEYDGPAWESWLADSRTYFAEKELRIKNEPDPGKQLKDLREEFDREVRTHTHLFIVDVANDPEALRQKYSQKNQFLILPATVRLEYYPSYVADGKKKEPPRIAGSVAEVLTDTLYVPKQQRTIFEKMIRDRVRRQNMSGAHLGDLDSMPSYEVTICVGKRAEPWITAVREIAIAPRK